MNNKMYWYYLIIENKVKINVFNNQVKYKEKNYN